MASSECPKKLLCNKNNCPGPGYVQVNNRETPNSVIGAAAANLTALGHTPVKVCLRGATKTAGRSEADALQRVARETDAAKRFLEIGFAVNLSPVTPKAFPPQTIVPR